MSSIWWRVFYQGFYMNINGNFAEHTLWFVVFMICSDINMWTCGICTRHLFFFCFVSFWQFHDFCLWKILLCRLLHLLNFDNSEIPRTGWFAKDPNILRHVGHILLQASFVQRSPRQIIIADDCFQHLNGPLDKSSQVVIKSTEKLFGSMFFAVCFFATRFNLTIIGSFWLHLFCGLYK